MAARTKVSKRTHSPAKTSSKSKRNRVRADVKRRAYRIWSVDILTGIAGGLLAGTLAMGENVSPHSVATVGFAILFFVFLVGVIRHRTELNSGLWSRRLDRAASIVEWALPIVVMSLLGAVATGSLTGEMISRWRIPL